jgi:hypothetical protein
MRQGTDKPEYTAALKKLIFPKINDPIKRCATELNRTFSKEEIL